MRYFLFSRLLCVLGCLGSLGGLFAGDERDCRDGIYNYWRQVHSTPYWDFIETQHPAIAYLKNETRDRFKVWHAATSPVHGFASTVQTSDYTVSLFIPAEGAPTFKDPSSDFINLLARHPTYQLRLSIVSRDFHVPPSEDGTTHELNAPFLAMNDVIYNARLSMHADVAEQLQDRVKVTRVSVANMKDVFRLEGDFSGPVDHNHLVMALRLTQRILTMAPVYP